LINQDINNFKNELDFIIQYITPFNELPYYNAVDINTLRDSDLLSSSQLIDVNVIAASRPTLTLRDQLTDKESSQISVILNQKQYNSILAYFSIAKTLFICLVLLLLMQLFANDINELLVEPIEGMMEKLMLMAKDPEAAAKGELNMNTEL
jgi:hypothetical protein